MSGRWRLVWRNSRPRCRWMCCIVKTVPGVLKELPVFAIVYNLMRLVMLPIGHAPTDRRGTDQFSGRVAVARGP